MAFLAKWRCLLCSKVVSKVSLLLSCLRSYKQLLQLPRQPTPTRDPSTYSLYTNVRSQKKNDSLTPIPRFETLNQSTSYRTWCNTKSLVRWNHVRLVAPVAGRWLHVRTLRLSPASACYGTVITSAHPSESRMTVQRGQIVGGALFVRVSRRNVRVLGVGQSTRTGVPCTVAGNNIVQLPRRPRL